MEVVIVSGVRTPIGAFNGSLKSKSAVELGALVIKEAYTIANLNAEDIGEIYMGHCLQAYCKQGTARQAMLQAGIPISTDATTINKLCSSGMKAISLGCQSIALGDQKIIIAGGMESMSNAPFYLPRAVPKYGGQMLVDSILYDGITCAINGLHMGSCTEKLVQKYNLTRADQDNFAIDSYERANHAMNSDVFNVEIVPCVIEDKNGITVVTCDDEPKRFMRDKILKLKPVFEPDGTITAANSSKLNDGAAAVALMSLEAAQAKGIKPLAQVISYADGANDPLYFGVAPSVAIRTALQKANLTIKDISYWEINEAFSAAVLANIKELGLDPTKVNIDGGAVSMGHPIGMSGARIVVHLVHRLKKDQYGVAAICNGGGGASAMIVKKLC